MVRTKTAKETDRALRVAAIVGLRERFPKLTQEMLARAGGLRRERYVAFERANSQLTSVNAVQEFGRCWALDFTHAQRLLTTRDPERTIDEFVPIVRDHAERLVREAQTLSAFEDRLKRRHKDESDFVAAAKAYVTWYLRRHPQTVADVDRLVIAVEKQLLELKDTLQPRSGHYPTKK